MTKSKMKSIHGFTLIELLIVIGIISTLLVMAGISGKQWMDKSNAEEQMRIMHTDLLQARTRAMVKNMQQFVIVNAGPASSYQIYEDTDDSGWTGAVTAKDTPLLSKPLRYPSNSNVTLIFDQRGLVTNPSTSLSNTMPDISFNTGAATPEYDCFQFYPTRINIGKMNGGSCDPR
jgi:prepilin-type N-terminal cleavage/methylation domain-containing protein